MPIKKSEIWKQYVEWVFDSCKGANCEYSCCDDDSVQERVIEFLKFHDKQKEHLKSHGIKIKFKKDRVEFSNCSDGKNCKFIKYALNKDFDPRPIDCKIYPFSVDWHNIDFDKKIVHLYLRSVKCPIIHMKAQLETFKQEVEMIIRRDFAALFDGANFTVKFSKKKNTTYNMKDTYSFLK